MRDAVCHSIVESALDRIQVWILVLSPPVKTWAGTCSVNQNRHEEQFR